MLPLALLLAHSLNQRGINGWLLPPMAGAAIGLGVGIIWSGFSMSEFAIQSATMGTVYGAMFWVILRGLAAITECFRL